MKNPCMGVLSERGRERGREGGREECLLPTKPRKRRAKR